MSDFITNEITFYCAECEQEKNKMDDDEKMFISDGVYDFCCECYEKLFVDKIVYSVRDGDGIYVCNEEFDDLYTARRQALERIDEETTIVIYRHPAGNEEDLVANGYEYVLTEMMRMSLTVDISDAGNDEIFAENTRRLTAHLNRQ